MNEGIHAWRYIEIENEKEGLWKIKIDFTFVWFLPPQTNTLTHTESCLYEYCVYLYIIEFIKSDYSILNVVKMWWVK